MKLHLIVISSILTLVGFCLFFVPKSYAVFFDDFSSSNLDLWTTFAGGYSLNGAGQLVPDVFGWTIENYDTKNYLVGRAGRSEYSYIYTKEHFDDFQYESEVENKGGIDLSMQFRVNDDASEFYELEYRFNDPNWSDGNNFVLYKYKNHMYYGPYIYVSAPRLGLNLTQNVKHNVQISMVGDVIKAYFDGTKVFEYIDPEPILSGRIGFKNWGGSYGNLENRFSYVKVTKETLFPSIEPTITSVPTAVPTFTPTPTLIPTPTIIPTLVPTEVPTPTIAPTATTVPTPVFVKPKVIILPGLGGSWNSEAMIYNLSVLPKDWEMTPFVHDYENLQKAFIENGYREGVDLFTWNYDWRKPVVKIQKDLNDFITQKITGTDRFVLVGHSLGGLVARDWAQYHSSDSRLQKVITLGSPHAGVVNAYEAWAGGKVIDYEKISLQSLMTNLLFQTWRTRYSSDVETVREIMPVLKDISPTFNFAEKNNSLIPLSSMSYKNDYILDRNEGVESIFPVLSPRVAIGQQTKSKILLAEQNLVDKVLGKWMDGSFVGYKYSDGDGTILKSSAKVSGDDFVELLGTHREMVDLSVNNIMDELSLRHLNSLNPTVDPLAQGAVFFIGSPAYLVVTCDGYLSKTSDKYGFVVFDTLGSGEKCGVQIKGTGNGAFHILVNYHGNPNEWLKYEGNIVKNQTINLDYQIINDQLRFVSKSYTTIWNTIRNKLNELLKKYPGNKNLLEAYKASEKQNWLLVLRWVYNFSNQSREMVVSWTIFDDLYHIPIESLDINSSTAKAYLTVGRVHWQKINRWILDHKFSWFEKQNIELANSWWQDAQNAYQSADYADLWKRIKMLEVVVAGLGPATFPM